MLDDALSALSVVGHEAVLWTLIAASGATAAIALERWLYTTRQRTRAEGLDGLTPAAVPLAPEVLDAVTAADGMSARVVSAGLGAGRTGGRAAAEEAMAVALSEEQEGLDRGLNVIGTVGSNAPFVGLLGTVLGIVRAFADLALDTAEGTNAVMSGISEALVATAVGLLVAIPAVVLFNILTRRNARIMQRLERLSRVVLMQVDAEGPSRIRRGA